MSESVRVRAPGKVNLYLGVGPRRDDGYHALATVFQAVSLYEDVTATAADEFTLTVEGALRGVPLDDRNLAMRAAKLLASATNFAGGVALRLSKAVPVAGGMGGGSADAAATLVACNALWGTQIPMTRLVKLGARLGADVPFALLGGTAIGMGRGDQLTRALEGGRFDWVLLVQEEGLSTPSIYHRLDAMRAREPKLADEPADALEVPPALLHALRAGDPLALAAALENELEAPALIENPRLRHVIEEGVAVGALSGIVSGSGPTLAFLCEDPTSAREVCEEMRSRGHFALHAFGSVPGARLIG